MSEKNNGSTEEVFRTEHDFEGEESLDTDILWAMSAITGEDPRELSPLHQSIDLAALDRLFAPPHRYTDREYAYVTFTYSGHEITVRSNGEILIRSLPDVNESSDE